MSQTIFKFPSVHDYSPENFLTSSSNQEAYDYVKNFPWDFYALNIYGGKSSGKSYLANLSDPSVKIFEDINENYDQEELLHQLNETKENGEFALLTSNQPVSEIGFNLADLNSRLKAIPAIEIHQPDEQLTYMLLARQFAAKQLTIGDDVLNFLAVRLERNFDAVFKTVEKIDKLSLQEKRNITIPLVKQIIYPND